MTDPAPVHADLERTLASLRLGVGASDLHGSLCGYFCGGGRATADDWLDALHIDVEGSADVAYRKLTIVYEACRTSFDSVPPRIDPLLPGATTGIASRANALVEWCRGFLGGVGLSGATARKALSSDAREILADLAAIGAAPVDGGDAEDDEDALRELVDFTCTAVALLQRELIDAAVIQSLH